MINNKPQYWNIENDNGELVTKKSREISDFVEPTWFNNFIKTATEKETLPPIDSPLSVYFSGDETYDIGYSNEGRKSNFLNRHLSHIAKAIAESKHILDLEEDWDEEGANATNSETYNRATNFVRDYSIKIFDSESRIKISAPSIEILRDGSIGVNWETPKANFLIVFNKLNEKVSYCYGKNKVNGIPFKTGVENDNGVDESVASWMKRNLRA